MKIFTDNQITKPMSQLLAPVCSEVQSKDIDIVLSPTTDNYVEDQSKNI